MTRSDPGSSPTGELRVVSLVPSATETLLAWDIEPVAVTRFCEQPELPHVGGTKDPHIDAIVELAPDLVVLCDEENRVEDAEALESAGLRLHTIVIRSVYDVAGEMAKLAAVLGLDADTYPAVAAATAPLELPEPVLPGTELRAFVPIWRRPWMTLNADTYGSSMLQALGVVNIFGDRPTRYPRTDLDEAIARRADVVLAPSEPYPFRERHVPELSQVAPVVLVDGKDLFWWGSRTPAAGHRLRSELRLDRGEL